MSKIIALIMAISSFNAFADNLYDHQTTNGSSRFAVDGAESIAF